MRSSCPPVLLCVAVVLGCHPTETPNPAACGEQRPCPEGFTCHPVDRRCYLEAALVDGGAVDAGSVDATTDAPRPPPDGDLASYAGLADAPGPAPDAAEGTLPDAGRPPAMLRLTPLLADFGDVDLGATSSPVPSPSRTTVARRRGRSTPPSMPRRASC